MSLRLRRRGRERPARKNPPRAPAEIPEDTEKLMSSSMENSKDPAISSTLLSRPTFPSVPEPHHDYSDVHEITNIPAPIPDTGLPIPSADTTTFVTHSSTSQSTPVASKTNHPHDSPKSTFPSLPFLQTLNLTQIEEEAAHSSLSRIIQSTLTSEPAQSTPMGGNSQARLPQRTTSPRLSATAIVALSVGVGLTALVVVVLVKFIKRPRRRKTPTPSLPILQDGCFTDNKAEGDGSPIFGGKERSSPTLEGRGPKGNTGLWTWTQYNSGIPKPAPMVTVTRSSSQILAMNRSENPDLIKGDAQTQNQRQYPFTGYGSTSANTPWKNKSAAPLQPVQNAITRAVSRLSTVSMSLYPNSPGGYSQMGADVGLAIDTVPLDESPNLAASKYKDRVMASRNRTSMMAPGSAKDAAALRRSQSFAYGGMEPTSPSPVSPNRTQLNGSRARIKSTYYTPGGYSRTSTDPKHNIYREHDGIHLEVAGVHRSDSRRGRDLTSALGLASPIPPSPQPTLYPDDSMSVIGEAKKVTVTGQSQKKPVPKQRFHYDSPPTDTAALGSLMMVDFAASKSTASLVNIRPSEAARAREAHEGTSNSQPMTGKSNLKKRIEDKPPRVPSPPPIPSLAQMALQHANPEGYADYHSPTYSIYGLYDGDRKSRGTSFAY